LVKVFLLGLCAAFLATKKRRKLVIEKKAKQIQEKKAKFSKSSNCSNHPTTVTAIKVANDHLKRNFLVFMVADKVF
jgi:hypothetical protein